MHSVVLLLQERSSSAPTAAPNVIQSVTRDDLRLTVAPSWIAS